MRVTSVVLPALIALLLAAPGEAHAEERYRIERTDNGFVRLDAETGRMSYCHEQGSQLVCRFAAEERAAFDDQLDAMQARIEALEARIAELEGARAPASGLPSDEEFERSLSYMERFFRRFMGIARDFEESSPAPG